MTACSTSCTREALSQTRGSNQCECHRHPWAMRACRPSPVWRRQAVESYHRSPASAPFPCCLRPPLHRRACRCLAVARLQRKLPKHRHCTAVPQPPSTCIDEHVSPAAFKNSLRTMTRGRDRAAAFWSVPPECVNDFGRRLSGGDEFRNHGYGAAAHHLATARAHSRCCPRACCLVLQRSINRCASCMTECSVHWPADAHAHSQPLAANPLGRRWLACT